MNSEIQEKKDLCSKIFITWMIMEREGEDMSNHKDEINEIFSAKILLKKFKVFDIDIVLPDYLLLLLDVCVDGNPGQIQIVLKDLLNHIKNNRGSIPAGYVITSTDFAYCFANDFPIMDIPEINEKYHKLWDGQKKERTKSSPFESDNLCDTIEWWKEVME